MALLYSGAKPLIYAILKEGIIIGGNINAKLYEIWTSGSGGVDCRHFLSRALAAPLSVDWNHLCNFGRKHHEEQSCEIILNLDQWFRRKCSLKVILIWSSGSPFVRQSNHLCNFCSGYYEEQYCEIILNLGQWFRRRCCFKDFLYGALAALLFGGAKAFMQF